MPPPLHLDYAKAQEVYRTGRWLCFDLETTNLDKGSALNPGNRVVMVAWQDGIAAYGSKLDSGVRHHYGNPLECSAFWAALEAADYLIAHNAKFEAHWLRRLGYDPTDKLWFDTLLAEKVRAGNRRMPLDLGSVSTRYGFEDKEELVASLIKTGVCPSEIPREPLVARCRRDVRTTAQVARKQIAGHAKQGSLQVVLTRCLLTPVLAQIEATGLCLDKERVHATYEEYVAEAIETTAALKKFTGGINPNSVDQMAVFLYQVLKFPEQKDARGKPRRGKATKPKKDGTNKWPEGRPKADADTLVWLETQARTKKQREFIALRQRYGKVTAALSKNLEFFKGVVDERPGCIFYGSLNQANTQTDRLSSTGLPQKFNQWPKVKSVQLQNSPRAFKKLFKSRDPDYWMTDADGAQLEFRVAAFLGQDRTAMANILDKGFDAHVQTAAVMAEQDYAALFARFSAGDAEAKELRQDAKPDTFKPLYGGQMGTEAQMRYYQWFQQNYAELYAAQERWVSHVMASGVLKMPWGKRFYWKFHLHPQSGAPMWGGKSIKPAIFNYPVQSLATAEIIPIAVWFLYHRSKQQKLRVRFVNTVHDSIAAEVHKEDLEAYKAAVVKAFTTDVYAYLERVYGLHFNVPLGCELKWGTHLGEGESFKIDVPNTRPAKLHHASAGRNSELSTKRRAEAA
jgi:DNA polymerase I-like protein with 3'-5' exonuclease and polymerase domains